MVTKRIASPAVTVRVSSWRFLLAVIPSPGLAHDPATFLQNIFSLLRTLFSSRSSLLPCHHHPF